MSRDKKSALLLTHGNNRRIRLPVMNQEVELSGKTAVKIGR